jgi:predicted SAM-dependent methyltransferase
MEDNNPEQLPPSEPKTEEPKLELAKPTRLIKLDLAAGQTPREGFEGVDWWYKGAQHVVDLRQYPWPWEDGSVDELHCSHYCEHIEMGYIQHQGVEKDTLFAFFDECYRILKPGGNMTVIVPCGRSNRGFQDPTHRRFFVAETFLYASAEWRAINKLDHYNTNCNFGVNCGHTMSAEMGLLHPEAQARRFNESWNTIYDWHCTMKSLKT